MGHALIDAVELKYQDLIARQGYFGWKGYLARPELRFRMNGESKLRLSIDTPGLYDCSTTAFLVYKELEARGIGVRFLGLSRVEGKHLRTSHNAVLAFDSVERLARVVDPTPMAGNIHLYNVHQINDRPHLDPFLDLGRTHGHLLDYFQWEGLSIHVDFFARVNSPLDGSIAQYPYTIGLWGVGSPSWASAVVEDSVLLVLNIDPEKLGGMQQGEWMRKPKKVLEELLGAKAVMACVLDEGEINALSEVLAPGILPATGLGRLSRLAGESALKHRLVQASEENLGLLLNIGFNLPLIIPEFSGTAVNVKTGERIPGYAAPDRE